jgi:hypothetical protein
MPNYKQKLTAPLTDQAFIEAMNKGKFTQTPEHQGYLTFLYYTGCRCSEGLKILANQFRRTPEILYVDVFFPAEQVKRIKKPSGKVLRVKTGETVYERLKHSKKTEPLEIPTNAPFVEYIIDSYIERKPEQRVWPYCRKTGFNIVKRVFPEGYPHYLRLSRITNFLLAGFTLPEILSWTGLNASTVNNYVGIVSIKRMGKSLFNKTP